jgi:hypothetical protein
MKLKAKQLLGFCCAPNKHLADLDCKTGPLPYEFADTAWELFSCSDNLSFVALPASDNPAAPFFSMSAMALTLFRSTVKDQATKRSLSGLLRS